MNAKHKETRQSIRGMATRSAREYLEMIGLPENEFKAVFGCDVLQQSMDIVADELAVSTRTLKRLRQRAYERIVSGFAEKVV